MELSLYQNDHKLIPGLFDFNNLTFPCLIHRVYDGDSMRACFVYQGKPITVAVRVLGIDTPELRTRCQHEKQLALRARDVARNLLNNQILNVRFHHNDKYGRSLVQIKLPGDIDYGGYMVAQGLAMAYAGGTKLSFDQLFIKNDPNK